MQTVSPRLNIPQSRFLALPHKFRAFVAGFGSGKTWVGCSGLSAHAWEFPRINAGYFAPSYPQIRDIFFPTIEEVAHDWGLRTEIRESNKEVHLYSGRQYRTTVICRSMDRPESIVGFKIGQALVDELDVMTRQKAEQAWRKIIARMRYKVDGLKNGVDVTTTPEGFKFTHQQFVKALQDKPELAKLYGLIQASTFENAKNLPADYIQSLFDSYPKQLIDAYLRGMFVNLTSGSVYPDFDRRLNHSFDSLQGGEPVMLGMDFNRLHMAAVAYVLRDGWPVAVDEITDGRDTPYMARLFKERYQDKGHAVTVYPDASGQNSSSKNASESDLSILREHGLTVRVNGSNPAVADRINAVNALILNGEGIRRLRVNTLRCPKLTEALEQQAYDKNGLPDKSSGVDHVIDAAGYPIAHMWPIVKKVATVQQFRW
ncbi:terminase large subunit [Comamonas humi]